MDEYSSADLVKQWQAGSEQAAGELVRRYAERLLGLARNLLSARLARHVDPEDVVQSVYRCFFTSARTDRYAFERSGDLWRLLALMTAHKVQGQVEHHAAGKRAFSRVHPFGTESSLLNLQAAVFSREPAPDEGAVLVEELERVLEPFPPLQRQIVELRLQGYLPGEIAERIGRSVRWVRRVLEQFRAGLEERAGLAAAG
jgi:DNA-directed RNA polymerase specialized sigma24 family protein